MRTSSAVRKLVVVSSSPPTKNPTPFSAFFEPVSSATQRYSWPDASAGTMSLIALLELIFVRSLAMPLSACATMT